MTIHRHDNRTRASGKTYYPFALRPAFLDSSLRWNDDGDRNGFVAIPMPPCHSWQMPDPSPARHAGAGREQAAGKVGAGVLSVRAVQFD